MLRELHIANLAVIEDVSIELSGGFNCFTGRTGAGKSLVLGAFEILLGLKSGPVAELLRPGADEARVTGVFELHDPEVLRDIAQAADLTLAPGDPLLITRKLFASGRSSVSVNGQPATAAMVRAVGELLVDVHGQHDHQYPLKPSNQLLILDAFGKSLDLRQRFGEVYARLRQLTTRKTELAASCALRRQQLELYEFQADEIDKADPGEGEYMELKNRHARLANLKRIGHEAGGAHAALYDSEGAVVERLQMIAHVLGDLGQLDAELSPLAEQVRTSALTLQEAAFELRRYIDKLELDPGELAEVEERLNTLNRLIAKYGGAGASASGDPLAAVLARRTELERRLTDLRGENQDLTGLDEQIAAAQKELRRIGEELSKARRAAAAKLRPLVEAQLRELGMAEASFEVAFEVGPAAPASAVVGPVVPAEEAPEVEPRPVQPALPGSPCGLDEAEVLVQTNPGQPARPLRKIASGGELSRIMLALKSILAQSDRVSVLVFDEIDANIGGRMGTVIGEKLRRLAGGNHGKPGAKRGARTTAGRHQVLCITHLPQIAAFADRHLRIAKEVVGQGASRQTRTSVTVLEGEKRIDELAEMLAGKQATQTTRRQAQELLATAGEKVPG